jgi:hypothetical protein
MAVGDDDTDFGISEAFSIHVIRLGRWANPSILESRLTA